jgi:TP901 family phage tail tape measure protein
MAGEAIAELFITLSMVDATAIAAMSEFAVAGEEMVATVSASLTELQARLAALGGEFSGLAAGVAEAGVAATADTAAITGLTTEIAGIGIKAESSAAEVQAAFAEMGASLEATGAKMATLGDEETAMLAKMKADNAAMAAASSEATMGQAALGDAMAGTTAKAAESNTTLGVSNNAIMAVGAAAVGTAYEAVKMAGDFQSAITRLNTSAGETQANLKMVNDGILAMAGSVGYSSDALATAMYKVESGGQHGADGLKVLQAAAQGAKTENADLTTVADALTSAMTDYKIPADQAATTTSKLVAATASGKMTFEELAGSMSAILPIASANHISLNDILGDLASMTVHGMSAQQATQNMANAIRNLSGGNAVASKELAALGMNATEVSKDLGAEGLSGTINEISQRITSQMGPDGLVVVNLTNALKGMSPAVQELGSKVLDGSMTMKDFTAAAKGLDVESAKQVTSFAALAGSMHGIGTESKSGSEILQSYSQALQKAMGGATGLNVALMIGGENAGNTAKAITAVSGASAEAGNNVQGWSEIQGNFNQKLDQSKSAFGALMISIGEKMLPALTAVMGVFASLATLLSQHQTIAVALAVVIGGTLVLAFLALTVAATKWVVTSAGGMAADLAKSAVWVAEKITGITAVTVASEGGAIATAAAWVAANIAMIAATGGIILIVGALVGLAYLLISHWQGVKTFFTGLWSGIKEAWDAFWGGFENPLATVGKSVNAFVGFFLNFGATVRRVVDAIGAVLTGGPAEWGKLLGQGVGYLLRAGRYLMDGLTDGLIAGLKAVDTFISNIPGWLITFFTNAPHWLYQAGSWIITGLWDGAKAVWGAFWGFVSGIPSAVISFFSNAPTWLYNVGADILHGLWNGFTSVISSIFSGIGQFILGFIHGFEQGFGIASPSTVMLSIGSDIIQGLWNGVVNTWNGFIGWVRGIPGWIIGAVGNLGSILYNAGAACMEGLYNGFLSVWNSVKDWLSSVGGWIQSLKGPLDKDKTLLTPHGNAIIQGLMDGMKAQMPALETQLAGVTNTIKSVGGGGQALSVSGGGLAVGAGGSGGVHIQLNVAGHVWTTQDLMREVQTQLLQHGTRNSSSGINYAYA